MKRQFEKSSGNKHMSGKGGRAGFSNVPRKRGRPRKEERKRGRPKNIKRDHAIPNVDKVDRVDKVDKPDERTKGVPVPVPDKRLGSVQVIESHLARTKEQWEADMQDKFTDVFSTNDDQVALAVWGHVAGLMWAEIGGVPVNDAVDMKMKCDEKIREAIVMHDPNYNAVAKVPDIEVHIIFTRVYNEVRNQFRGKMTTESPASMTPCSPPRSPQYPRCCSPQSLRPSPPTSARSSSPD